MAETVVKSIAVEAVQCAPALATTIKSLVWMNTEATDSIEQGLLKEALHEATPQGRFQMLTSLLLGLCTEPSTQPRRWETACALLHTFYVAEVLSVLSSLGSRELFSSELARSIAAGSASASAIWQHLLTGCTSEKEATQEDAMMCATIIPLRTREEAAGVLKLALNPFLAKVRILLSLIYEGQEDPLLSISLLGPSPMPDEEHRTLSCAAMRLPDVDDLLFGASAASLVETPLSAQTSTPLPLAFVRNSRRGLQPLSPLVLVLVSDDADRSSLEDVEPPAHVWQITQESLDRIIATNKNEVVRLETPSGMKGKLLCLACRLTLPVITGRVYQRFYTQFVHARCTVCQTSPPIPTLCLLCGTFLCCNSECCRRHGGSGEMLGEVTHHAQSCGFGTCVFLQLSNSLVHIVTDGYIACWGSLYLDGHGEEEYNLSRPLHISEARLQQLTQSVREVSFDFEARLKWKKVIFV